MSKKIKKRILKKFDKKFELHDLGKDVFTLCCNYGDGSCDGGISIQKEGEEETRQHLRKVKSFLFQALEEVEAEAREGVYKRFLEELPQFMADDYAPKVVGECIRACKRATLPPPEKEEVGE